MQKKFANLKNIIWISKYSRSNGKEEKSVKKNSQNTEDWLGR